MSFNKDYFSLVHAIGGKGGNSLWHYFDYAGDNVASVFTGSSGGTPNATFFSTAFTQSGIVARAGDMIMVAARSNTSGNNNTATPCLLCVPTTWDANGASVVLALGTLQG